ncbi:MAG TPA: Ldh family oxidoreductase [Burkholderiaceae bacterium]|nr:Ldh family oxidoreductase [Burkholderiaceae bacterium]
MTLERVEQSRLTEITVKALQTYGLSEPDARSTAEILVLADMFGLHTHGVSRVESYGERLDLGGIKASAEMKIEKSALAISKLDGDNGIGPLVGQTALKEAMALAQQTGVGVVFARGSNHFGPISPYAFLAAQQGFASFICSNATTTIAPWGGRDARLGNSPLGFGIPNPGGDPFLLDMALSVVARAKIRQALQQGAAIPSTWATDKEGRPTTDPKAALSGFLMAIGGHKGYGLALVVDLLAGLLSGASYLTRIQSWVDNPEAPQDLGHFFLLIDTARLGGADWLRDRMEDFRGILHDTPAADPAMPVIVPGELELDKYRLAQTSGVEVEKASMEHLLERTAR